MNSDLVRLTKLSLEHDLNESEIIKKCILLNIPIYLDFTKDLYPNGRGVFKGRAKIPNFSSFDICLSGLAKITEDGLCELEQRLKQGLANYNLIVGLELKLQSLEKIKFFENIVVQMLDPVRYPSNRSSNATLPLLSIKKSDLGKFSFPSAKEKHLVQVSCRKKKKINNSSPRTPTNVFIDRQVQSQQHNWKLAWEEFRQLGEKSEWLTFGDFNCKFKKTTKFQYNSHRQAVKIEFDEELKVPTIISDRSFYRMFQRRLKKHMTHL